MNSEKFTIALYQEHNTLSEMLSNYKEACIEQYSDLETLLESMYDKNIDLLVSEITTLDDSMQYTLDIFNEQAVVLNIPIICIAPEEFLNDDFLQKYSEIDFIRKPITLTKIMHRLKVYMNCFEKNREFLLSNEMAKRELQKIQAIINSHTNMLLLYQGDTISMVNQKFLDFFRFDSLEAFMLHGDSAHSYGFTLHDNELRYTQVSENYSPNGWIKELSALEDAKRVITLRDSKRISHSFSVNITKFTLDAEYTLIHFDDITTLYNQSKRYEIYAHYDTLTALFNRRKFHEELDKHIESTKRYHYELSLILLDIDFFKKINDTFGHNEGDTILKLLASTLKEHVRKEDIVARWGGEEFIILLPFTSKQSAQSVAENLKNYIHNIILPDGQALTCSFGIASYVENIELEAWIERADKALYVAKESGRNCVKVYEKE